MYCSVQIHAIVFKVEVALEAPRGNCRGAVCIYQVGELVVLSSQRANGDTSLEPLPPFTVRQRRAPQSQHGATPNPTVIRPFFTYYMYGNHDRGFVMCYLIKRGRATHMPCHYWRETEHAGARIVDAAEYAMYSMLNRTCTGQRRRSSRRRRPCSNASATSITLSGDGSRTGRIACALPTFRSTTYSRHHILHARVPDAYYRRMQSLSCQSRRRMHECKRGVTLTLTWSVIFVGGVVWRTSRGASMRWSSGGVGDTLGSGVGSGDAPSTLWVRGPHLELLVVLRYQFEVPPHL